MENKSKETAKNNTTTKKVLLSVIGAIVIAAVILIMVLMAGSTRQTVTAEELMKDPIIEPYLEEEAEKEDAENREIGEETDIRQEEQGGENATIIIEESQDNTADKPTETTTKKNAEMSAEKVAEEAAENNEKGTNETEDDPDRIDFYFE